jgi:hypothetical protein
MQIQTTNKFSIGDRVATKRIGLPVVGTVSGIIHPDINFFENVEKTKWDIYPDWNQKYSYFVKFDEKVRIESFEDFKSSLNQSVLDGFSGILQEEFISAQVRQMYEKLPTYIFNIYPEDDLEII